MTINKQKFDTWIKKHRLFAMAAPILIFLLIFFVATSLKSVSEEKNGTLPQNGYNNLLPDGNNGLEVKQPNEYYQLSLQDSLERLRDPRHIRNILTTKTSNDSLEDVLNELDNFSWDEPDNKVEPTGDLTVPENAPPEYVVKKTKAQEKLEYRKLLMEAREERLSRSQDYSAPYTEKTNDNISNTVSFDAAIYRDQFILPGNRVTLILREEVEYMGRQFPKNTFVYARSNLQGSRILLEVTNIDNVALPLTAIDQEDGMAGLHNERAGELLHEFHRSLQQQGIDGLTEVADGLDGTPMTGNLIRSFGTFFQRKKYRQQDKILLVNGDRVLLVPKT
ncbi:MAG: conjugative transposon protein TraM [Anaerorhabdus sp.]|uniref:conjugative transposon protein TraM n=1 Tax=Anaerorhabdus sp. TaxID=1872524 RepID=UPI003A890A7F